MTIMLEPHRKRLTEDIEKIDAELARLHNVDRHLHLDKRKLTKALEALGPARANGTFPPDRAEIARRAQASRSPEERSESARKASRTKKGRRGRPPGTGKRDKEVIQILSTAGKDTGFTIGELALMLKIKPNYLYRVMPKLAHDRKVKKVGTRWFIR